PQLDLATISEVGMNRLGSQPWQHILSLSCYLNTSTKYCYLNAVDLNASKRLFCHVPARKHSLREVLATNIRVLRNQQGWSQEDLGAEAELHRTFIGAVERAERNISIDNVEKLSAALGVDGWTLLKPR